MKESNVLNLTVAEIQEKIQELQKQLVQLGEEESDLGEKAVQKLTGLEKIKLTEVAKKRFEIKAIIKSYNEILKKRLYFDKEMICKRTYIQGTERALENYKASDTSGFSWGLDELESEGRKVFFQGITEDQLKKEVITVINYGEFRFLEGQSGVNIEDIPYESISRLYEISPLLRCDGKNIVTAQDIRQVLEKDNRDINEKIRLLRISRGEGKNAREYFILSSVTEKDLEDTEIQKFFLEFYCSDAYLRQVAEGENGIYAGRIKKCEDGICKIRFKENSVRAAKLAKNVPGTTQLIVQSIDKGSILKVPTGHEFLGQILDRFTVELYKNRQEGR